ncbi:hypothetical protein D9M73_214130 [compost metagenome]
MRCHCCRLTVSSGKFCSIDWPTNSCRPSRASALWLASSTRYWLSRTRMPVRMRCRISALNSSRLATVAARCSARDSLKRWRRVSAWISSADAKHIAPSPPACT